MPVHTAGSLAGCGVVCARVCMRTHHTTLVYVCVFFLFLLLHFKFGSDVIQNKNMRRFPAMNFGAFLCTVVLAGLV